MPDKKKFEVIISTTGCIVHRTYHAEADDAEHARRIVRDDDMRCCVTEEIDDGYKDDVDDWEVRELK